MAALLLWLAHLLVVVALTVAYRISPWHPLASIPGPLINKITSLRLLQIVASGDRHLIIKDLHNKYGKVVRTGPNTISFNSHSAVATIYANAKAWDKSDAYIPGRVPGHGLFFMPGREEHNLRRKIWAGGFTNEALKGYEPVLLQRSNELSRCIDNRADADGVISLSDAIQHWSYDIMGTLVFGGSNRIELMADGDADNLVKNGQFATVLFEVLGEVPSLFDLMSHLPVTKNIHMLEALAARLMKHRRADASAVKSDFASHLLGEHDSALPKLNDKDLVLDTVFAIQAGSDTTSGVAILNFYHILANPPVYAKLLDELTAVFPDGDPMSLHCQALADLPYLNAVVNESLRLGAPFPGLPRVSPPGGAMLDEVFVPEGTIVGVPAWTQHTAEENFFPDPEVFRPERWLTRAADSSCKTRKAALMTFSFGPFGCLGKTLAFQEMRLLTASLMLSHELAFAPGFDRDAFVAGISNMRTTFFARPLMVTAKRRSL